jgi:phosphopantetheinyl transferase
MLVDSPTRERCARFYHRADAYSAHAHVPCPAPLSQSQRMVPRVSRRPPAPAGAARAQRCAARLDRGRRDRRAQAVHRACASFLLSFLRGAEKAQASPPLEPPLAFNVSHDSELVALAFARDARDGVGVDVMRIAPPRRGSFASFVESVGDTVRPAVLAS